jgi:hypothetical protein
MSTKTHAHKDKYEDNNKDFFVTRIKVIRRLKTAQIARGERDVLQAIHSRMLKNANPTASSLEWTKHGQRHIIILNIISYLSVREGIRHIKVYNPTMIAAVNTPLNVPLGLSNHDHLPVHRAGTHSLHAKQNGTKG